jgi:phosphoribosylglycinamide formyltransferase 1
MKLVRIAVLASGSGSNAEVLISYFEKSEIGRVVLVLTNRPQAGVVARALRLGVALEVVPFEADGPELGQALTSAEIKLVLLAGWLRKVPADVLAAYQGRILNLHPSLLPRYGGAGMYGKRVHEAVLSAGDRESGITIHEVEGEYDTGRIIFQERLVVAPEMDAEALAEAIHKLEHAHYPRVAEDYAQGLAGVGGSRNPGPGGKPYI